jgi:osmoprotectant transport system substrate-binding protein
MAKYNIRSVSMKRRLLASVLVTALLLTGLTACGKKKDSNPVVVSSKDFTESIVIGEIYALALENNGIPVERKLKLGFAVVRDAIKNGEIDLYPEYTGTGLLTVLNEDPIYDPQQCYDAVKKGYKEKFNIDWLAHSDVNDAEGLAITKAAADQYGIKTFSDLWAHASELNFAANGEFYESEGAYKRLVEVYGEPKFKDALTMDHVLTYQAARDGKVDAISVYTTEGNLAGGDFVILEDDKGAWPPYYLVPIIRNEALKAHPEAEGILDKVTATFTDENVIAMNAKVDIDGDEYEDVAKDYYDSIKGIFK